MKNYMIMKETLLNSKGSMVFLRVNKTEYRGIITSTDDGDGIWICENYEEPPAKQLEEFVAFVEIDEWELQ